MCGNEDNIRCSSLTVRGGGGIDLSKLCIISQQCRYVRGYDRLLQKLVTTVSIVFDFFQFEKASSVRCGVRIEASIYTQWVYIHICPVH